MNLKITAAAAAIVLSLAGLSMSTGNASADVGYRAGVYLGFSSPGVHAGVGVPVYSHAPRYRRWHRPHRRWRRCRPIFAKRRALVPGHGWRIVKVKVGRSCKRRYWR